jgi:hypothetical protein
MTGRSVNRVIVKSTNLSERDSAKEAFEPKGPQGLDKDRLRWIGKGTSYPARDSASLAC